MSMDEDADIELPVVATASIHVVCPRERRDRTAQEKCHPRARQFRARGAAAPHTCPQHSTCERIMPQRFADRRLVFRRITVTCLTAASLALSGFSQTVAAAKNSATTPATAPSTKFLVGRITAPEIPES